ncbi:MAG TPA: STAS domain-containing protein [Rhodocyclaceae bacterium]|nr:STAS domain-containing protein [Rhodocyclaceae bacterium]
MNIAIQIAETALDILMEGELTIYTAAELRNQFMTVLASACEGMNVRIDMQAVTEIDSAGVQLLVLLKRELLTLGLFVKIVRWSRVVGETFEFVGLTEFLTEAPL